MDDVRPDPLPTLPPAPPPPAHLLMTVFWMLLGGAAGIKFAQGLWHLIGWGAGEVSVAVPVGGVAGAAVGALLGRISNPRRIVRAATVRERAGVPSRSRRGRSGWK